MVSPIAVAPFDTSGDVFETARRHVVISAVGAPVALSVGRIGRATTFSIYTTCDVFIKSRKTHILANFLHYSIFEAQGVTQLR